jgi:CspA family cold shock protein
LIANCEQENLVTNRKFSSPKKAFLLTIREAEKNLSKPKNEISYSRKNRRGRMKGTVKWFNANKGYGFIVTDDNREFFVHWKSIVTSSPMDLKVLEPNEPVEFDLIETDKGVQAINIIKLDNRG